MNARDKRRAYLLEKGLTTLLNRLYETFGDRPFQDRNGQAFKKIELHIDRMKVWAWRLGSGRDSELLIEKAQKWVKQAKKREAKRRYGKV